MAENDPYQSFLTELRRGSLTLAVLACLKKPYYGYALLQAMQDRGISIEANTLYPLLRRLEGQGLLTSDWDTSESRPRKYYLINDKGREVFRALMAEWERMQRSMDIICGEEEKDD